MLFFVKSKYIAIIAQKTGIIHLFKFKNPTSTSQTNKESYSVPLNVTLDALPALQTWTANSTARPCLVPIRRFPSPCRSIHFGDVSKANIFSWTTWPETLWPLGIIGLGTRKRKTVITWHSQVSGLRFSMKNLILKVSNIFEVTWVVVCDENYTFLGGGGRGQQKLINRPEWTSGKLVSFMLKMFRQVHLQALNSVWQLSKPVVLWT